MHEGAKAHSRGHNNIRSSTLRGHSVNFATHMSANSRCAQLCCTSAVDNNAVTSKRGRNNAKSAKCLRLTARHGHMQAKRDVLGSRGGNKKLSRGPAGKSCMDVHLGVVRAGLACVVAMEGEAPWQCVSVVGINEACMCASHRGCRE